ncbi:MAG: Lrp/AsnC family transcriptional regulator [archaeon]|nr:Lrp/AsnC family transcriptional regulator [archaeon]
MQKMKLGIKDWKILTELDKDCRQSDARIGKKVGFSQQVVSYRVNRLIDGGVIRQLYTVIDLTKRGYSSYKAYFNL